MISPLFSFQPPTGGDLLLKSSNGVVFHAHSVLLAIASPVFAGMLSTATKKDTIELAEDAESVSLMLRFIYPPMFLDNLTLPLLRKSLHMGQKYDITGIPSAIDYVLSHSSDENYIFQLGPLDVFGLAISYKLKTTQGVVAKLIQQPRNHEDVMRFAKILPNHSSVFGLLGAHLVRTKSLLALQEDLSIAVPMNPKGSIIYSELLMCIACIERLPFPLLLGMHYLPPWMQSWGNLAIPQFIYEPLHECERYFEATILDKIARNEYNCLDCLNAGRCAGNGEVFRDWTRWMKGQVAEVFSSMGPLYDI
ncbi:hypothetical protein FRC09_016455 [Ceratobasidium sp. 395]|nr:hypothetical protein FRC09_016455 [Ceratobasidium sp. 395]